MTQEQIEKLNELAHQIAYDATSGIIECSSYQPVDGWLEIAADEENYADDLRYLEMRGLLVRNPDNPRLLKILPVEEAKA